MGEVGGGEATNDGIGDVADAGLEGKEVVGESAVFDFILEEVHDVASNGLGGVIDVGEGSAVIGEVGLDDGDDLGLIDVHDVGADSRSSGGMGKKYLSSTRLMR